MRPRVHWGLGVLTTFLVAVLIGFRMEACSGTPDVSREGDICLGIRFPGRDQGVVCAPTLEKIAGEAEVRLGLPRACARHSLPPETRSGDYLVFHMDNGLCEMDPPKPLPPSQGLLLGALVDINRTDAAGLAVLPGIGPVRARAIVAYRERHGDFRCPEDLVAVNGIGRKTMARLLPWLDTSRGAFSLCTSMQH